MGCCSDLARPDLTEDQGEGGQWVPHFKLGLYHRPDQLPQRRQRRPDLRSVQSQYLHLGVGGQLAGVEIMTSKHREVS